MADAQMLSLYLRDMASALDLRTWGHNCVPFIVYRLDDKAQGRADGVDVLAHDPLHDCGLARIVQSPGRTCLVSRSSPSPHI